MVVLLTETLTILVATLVPGAPKGAAVCKGIQLKCVILWFIHLLNEVSSPYIIHIYIYILYVYIYIIIYIYYVVFTTWNGDVSCI